MKFSITPSAKGNYVTPSGAPVSVAPAEYGKDYADEAAFTAEFKLVPKALHDARETKLAALQKGYEDALQKGVAAGGITLDASEKAQTDFNHLITLLREVEELLPQDAREAFRASEQTVTDAAGALHQLSVSALRALIVGYGQSIYALRAALMEKVAAEENP